MTHDSTMKTADPRSTLYADELARELLEKMT